MFIVVLVNQQGNHSDSERIQTLEQQLNTCPGLVLERSFERAVGDQIVGILSGPASIAQLLLLLDESGNEWLTGIGIGELDSIGDTARLLSGPALRDAQSALARAPRALGGVAVEGASEFVADVDSATTLLCDVLRSRSERQRQVVVLRRRSETGEEIAEHMGISRRAVHKHLTAARYTLELEARRLLDRLTARAVTVASN